MFWYLYLNILIINDHYKHINDPKNKTMFKTAGERDLYYKVVDYIRRFKSKSIPIASLGENQDNDYKRIDSFKMGYQRGSPDLIIASNHKDYNSWYIEFNQ